MRSRRARREIVRRGSWVRKEKRRRLRDAVVLWGVQGLVLGAVVVKMFLGDLSFLSAHVLQ